MDKKYLKEHNLLEAHKQFMRLCEWSYTPILEDDDEQDQDNGQQPSMGGDAQADGAANSNAMGGDAPMNGASDPNVNGDMPPMDGGADPNAMNGESDPNANGDMPPMDGGADPNANGDMPPMDGGADPNAMGDDMPPMEDEEVIDVDDITNAQEKMNTKVNHVGKELGNVDDKIETLLTSLAKMEQMIDSNNQEIAKFKQEFEKRNPTQTERLNLRSLDSYPFNVNPKDYWAEKGVDPNSNYSGYGDNDKSTTDEYIITNNDVDDFDEREISQSFNIADELNQDIKKIFGL